MRLGWSGEGDVREWCPTHLEHILDEDMLGEAWLLGRNQALFSSPSSSTELMVQPWLGVVGSLGRVAFERKRVACLTPNVTLRQWRRLEAAGDGGPARGRGAAAVCAAEGEARARRVQCVRRYAGGEHNFALARFEERQVLMSVHGAGALGGSSELLAPWFISGLRHHAPG